MERLSPQNKKNEVRKAAEKDFNERKEQFRKQIIQVSYIRADFEGFLYDLTFFDSEIKYF